ncbi:MAG: molybdate ABC transporter substrate-binding protein [Candidatus Omnitrophica bacterium]|nr:molybdate ABC transporter substrate-binding protein [Candidatus Omnitrophota bacterium]MBU1923969.1 molybdate ABC transporter substrate-binding protein [Candidatus Omnitrophota bacterium]
MKKNLSLIVILTVFLAFLITMTYFSQSLDRKNRTPLDIYIPCGLTLPFKELALAFEQAHGNIKVEATFDNAVILTRLIREKGKRPDLFISPGEKEIGILDREGLLDKGSVKAFGKYELILIAPSSAKEINGLDDLLKDSVRVIAIANPDYNSVGDYSVTALKELGYWDKLQKSKSIMFTNTPIEALSFVAANKADAGIHYNVCPFETDSGKVSQGAIKVIAQLPGTSHPPIYNYIGILSATKNDKVAQSFIDFMFSAKGQKILSRYGLGGNTKQPNQGFSGQTKAKVNIQAYYPFNEEHLYIKDYLETLPQKFNGEVKVECVDFRSDEGYVLWRKTGLSCGGILINGKYKFSINKDGQAKEVEFLKKIDLFWTKDELEAAIKQELGK